MQKTYTVLTDRAILKIHGPDGENFLHKLTTNDVRTLQKVEKITSCLDGYSTIKSSPPLYSLFLNSQSKVLYDAIIWRIEQDFYTEIPKLYLQDFITYLLKYKLRAQISIQECPEIIVLWTESPELDFYEDPRSQTFGYRILAEINDAANLQNGLYTEKQRQLGNEIDIIKAASLSANYPLFSYDYDPEQYFATDLNLDLFNAISFTKGCYPGQESFNKIHYRGKRKKTVTPIEIEQNYNWRRGDIILHDGVEIGKLLGHRQSTKEHCIGLALIDRTASETTAGSPLTVTVQSMSQPPNIEQKHYNATLKLN